MRSWSTFGARMNHKQTQTHKTHHSSNLGEATTFPFIIFSMIGLPWDLHPNVILSRNPQLGNLEIGEIGFPTTLEAHNFFV
jgi:hypothetical protein